MAVSKNMMFKKTIDYVYKNSEFYRNKLKENNMSIEEIKNIDDIKKLPFMDKEDLVNNYPYGLFMTPLDEVKEIHSSSGTTSSPIVIGFNDHDLKLWAEANAELCRIEGFKKDDVVQICVGYGMFTGAIGFHRGLLEIGATIVPAGIGNTAKQITYLQDFKVTAIETTPNYAVYLAETAKKKGVDIKKLNIRKVSVGSEKLTSELRKRIIELYGENVSITQNYGLCEMMGPTVGAECDCHNGIHITSKFYPEIINPKTGETLPEGEVGELVLTHFDTEVVPMIRYRTHDIAILKKVKCECGYEGYSIVEILGRTDSMIKVRGVKVFPSQIEEVILKNKQVTSNYEVAIYNENYKDYILIKIEQLEHKNNENSRKEIEEELKDEIKSVLGISVDVKLEKFGTLKRFEGKANRVIDLR